VVTGSAVRDRAGTGVASTGSGRRVPTPAGRTGARLAVLALALLSLVGCVSEAREQELGDAIASDINERIPLIRDPLLNAYVSRIGEQLVKVSDRPEVPYNFYIVNSAEVNAFALPGGHIYLTRGLIARTESGNELAGVLAHEIGHVAARHGIQKLERHLRTGSLVGVMYRLILGGEPAILQQNALQLAGVLWSATHSRQDEAEADRLAVRYMLRSGVDPEGMLSLLGTLVEEEHRDDRRVAEWFSTHPLTEDRIVHIQSVIAEKTGDTAPVVRVRIPSYGLFLRRLALLPPPPDFYGF
jgi:beta-barrel assembly-enhancing protease